MKKGTALALLLILTAVFPVFAQKFAISVNPIGLALGLANLRVEYLGIEKVGVFGGGVFAMAKSGDISATALGGEGGGRYYFSGGHRGGYGEAGVGFISLTVKNDNTGRSSTGTIIYPFGLIGYRFGSQFFFDGGIGAAYYIGEVKVDGQGVGAFSGFFPLLQLALGIKF